MPRTETCGACNGAGEANDLLTGDGPCRECGGNGYVKTPSTFESMTLGEISTAAQNASLQRAVKTMRENDDVAPLLDPSADIDLTNDKPVPGRMANQTWRILEEQRMAAEDTIKECEHEIDRWTAKLDDAMKTTAGCRAGQAALDGGL